MHLNLYYICDGLLAFKYAGKIQNDEHSPKVDDTINQLNDKAFKLIENLSLNSYFL